MPTERGLTATTLSRIFCLDNLLLVDIYNRAKKLHIEPQLRRTVFIIETKHERDNSAMEVIRSLYGSEEGNLITEVDEKSIILIQALDEGGL